MPVAILDVWPDMWKKKVGIVALAPNQQYVVTADNYNRLQLWDILAHKPVRRLPSGNHETFSVAVSPDSKLILSGDDAWVVHLWDAETGEELRTWQEPEQWLCNVALSSDGNTAAIGGISGNILVCDIVTGKVIQKFKGKDDGESFTVHISPDSTLVALGTSWGGVFIWHVHTGDLIRGLVHTVNGLPCPVSKVFFSPDSKHIISSGSSCIIWDIKSGSPLKELVVESNTLGKAEFSPDGKYVVTDDSMRNAVILFDCLTGDQIREFVGHTDTVRTTVFSSDGLYILSGSNDGTVRLWDTQTGKELHRLLLIQR